MKSLGALTCERFPPLFHQSTWGVQHVSLLLPTWPLPLGSCQQAGGLFLNKCRFWRLWLAVIGAINPLTSAFSMFLLLRSVLRNSSRNPIGFYHGPGQLSMLVCLHGTHRGNHCINASPATCALPSVSFWLLSISHAWEHGICADEDRLHRGLAWVLACPFCIISLSRFRTQHSSGLHTSVWTCVSGQLLGSWAILLSCS